MKLIEIKAPLKLQTETLLTGRWNSKTVLTTTEKANSEIARV